MRILNFDKGSSAIKKTHSISLLMLIFTFPVFFSFSETIKLKNGKTLEAKIIERTQEYVKLEISGISFKYYLDEIESIDGKPVDVVKNQYLTTESSKIFEKINSAIVSIVSLDEQKKEQMLGSAFIVDKNGLLLTNYHLFSPFLQQIDNLKVKLKTGKVYSIDSIVYKDTELNLLILKINADNLPSILLGDSDKIKVGEKIYVATGSLSSKFSFFKGTISEIKYFNNRKFLQFDSPTFSSDTIGLIINLQSETIGLIILEKNFLKETTDVKNLKLALAINEIKPHLVHKAKMTLKDLFATRQTSQTGYFFTRDNEARLRANHDQTISEYTQILKDNPNNIRAYNNRGLAYYYKGNYDQAISDFTQALEINPNLAEIYSNRGMVYHKKGNYEQAMSDFNQALKINPNFADAYNNRGLLYASMGNYDQAISDYNKALEFDPNYGFAYYNRAMAYFYKGNYNKAWEDVEKAKSLGYNVSIEFLEKLRKASGRQ